MSSQRSSAGGELMGAKRARLAYRMNSLKTPKQNDGKTGNQHRFRNQKEKVARVGSILPSGGRLPFSDRRSFIEELDFARTNLDTSPAFVRFWRDVRLHCLSFHLLVHNRARIVDIIIRHIQVEHNVALQTILNLTAKLAATLGSEFFKSFPPLFEALVSAIHPPYVEETAMIFRTLALLLKFLAPYVIKHNLAILDRFYGPLLGHRKAYIRAFAAELVAFIFRKMDVLVASAHLKRLFRAVCRTEAIHNPDLRMGLSQLLFQIVRNAQSQFHSRMLHLVPTIGRLFDEQHLVGSVQLPPPPQAETRTDDQDALDTGASENLFLHERYTVVFHAFLKMIRHTSRATAGPLLVHLHDELRYALQRCSVTVQLSTETPGEAAKLPKNSLDQCAWNESRAQFSSNYAARLIGIVAEFVRFRKGTLVGRDERSRLLEVVKLLFLPATNEQVSSCTAGSAARKKIMKKKKSQRDIADESTTEDTVFPPESFIAEHHGEEFRDACVTLFKTCWNIYCSNDKKAGTRHFREAGVDNPDDAGGDEDGKIAKTLRKCLRRTLFHPSLGPVSAARVIRMMGHNSTPRANEHQKPDTAEPNDALQTFWEEASQPLLSLCAQNIAIPAQFNNTAALVCQLAPMLKVHLKSHSAIQSRLQKAPGGPLKTGDGLRRKRKGGPTSSATVYSVLPQPLLRTLVRLLREAANGALIPNLKKRTKKGGNSHGLVLTDDWSPHWGNVQLVTLFSRHIHAEFTAQGKSLTTLQGHVEKIFNLAVSNAFGGGVASHASDMPAPLACLVAQATDMVVSSRLFGPDRMLSAFLPKVAALLESAVSAWQARSKRQGDSNLVRLVDTCEDVGILLYSFDRLLQEVCNDRTADFSADGFSFSARIYELILAGLRCSRCDARAKSLHILEQMVDQKFVPAGIDSSILPFPTSLELIHHLQFVERRGHLPMEERKVTNVVEQVCQAAQQRRLSDGDRLVAVCHAVGLVSVAYSKLWPNITKLLTALAASNAGAAKRKQGKKGERPASAGPNSSQKDSTHELSSANAEMVFGVCLESLRSLLSERTKPETEETSSHPLIVKDGAESTQSTSQQCNDDNGSMSAGSTTVIEEDTEFDTETAGDFELVPLHVHFENARQGLFLGTDVDGDEITSETQGSVSYAHDNSAKTTYSVGGSTDGNRSANITTRVVTLTSAMATSCAPRLLRPRFAERVIALLFRYIVAEFGHDQYTDDAEAQEILYMLLHAPDTPAGIIDTADESSTSDSSNDAVQPLEFFIQGAPASASNIAGSPSTSEITVRIKQLLQLVCASPNLQSSRLCPQMRAVATVFLGKPAISGDALTLLGHISGKRLQRYISVLEHLVDDQTSRDTMATFDLSPSASSSSALHAQRQNVGGKNNAKEQDRNNLPKCIRDSDRHDVVPLVIRLLLGRMMHRRRHRDDVKTFRQRCARYLNNLETKELDTFTGLLLREFRPATTHGKGDISGSTDAEKTIATTLDAVRRVSLRRQVGLLQLLQAIVPSLAKLVLASLDDVLPVLVALQHLGTDNKKLRGETLRTIVTLFSALPSSTSYCTWIPFLMAPLEPLITAMSGSVIGSGNASQLLVLIETMTRYGSSFFYLSLPTQRRLFQEQFAQNDTATSTTVTWVSEKTSVVAARLLQVVECLAQDILREKSTEQLASELHNRRRSADKTSAAAMEPILATVLQLLENVVNLTRPPALSIADEYLLGKNGNSHEAHNENDASAERTLGIRFNVYEPLAPGFKCEELEDNGRKLASEFLKHASVPLLRIFHRRFSALQQATNQSITRTPLATRQLHVIAELSKYIDANNLASAPTVSGEAARVASATDTVATDLVDMFIPFLEDPARRMFNSKCAILRILARTLRLIPNPGHYVQQIGRLLGPWQCGGEQFATKIPRNLIIDVVASAGGTDSAWTGVAEDLRELNTWSKDALEEFDFESRNKAMQRFNAKGGRFQELMHMHTLQRPLLAPVLQHYVFMLHNEEMFVRQAAFHGLEVFVGFLFAELRHSAGERGCDNLISLLTNVLLPTLHESMKSEQSNVRKGVLGIIACIIRHGRDANDAGEKWLDEESSCVSSTSGQVDLRTALHLDLASLLNDADREQDFFANLRHIQVHRVTRAVQELQLRLSQESRSILNLTEHTIQNVVLPVAQHFVNESTDQKTSQLKEKAVALVGALAKRMSWQNYWALLRTTIKSINALPSRERVLVKQTCVILDAFHFEVTDLVMSFAEARRRGLIADEERRKAATVDEHGNASDGVAKRAESATRDKDAQPSTAVVDSTLGDRVEAAHELATSPDTIARTMRFNALPMLRSLLTKRMENNAVELRSSVAIAVVKLISVMGPKTTEAHLSEIVIKVVNVLKSRNQSTRDEAAATLTEILKIAGVTLLPMVLETLNSILCSGFQVHVLGSVVHGLVRGTLVQIHEQSEEHSGTDGGSSKAAPADQKKVSKGKRVAARYLAGMKADDDTVWRCLPVLVAVVLEDVFGDTAAQKEDDSGYRPDGGNAGMRELKSCKSFDTFEVVCSAIKFLPDASIHVILSPILQKLAGHPSQKTVNKVQRLLHRAVVGLAHNTTVTVPKLLVYVHELVSNYAFLDIRREKKNASTDGHRRHRGTDVWLAGEGGLDEHALTKPGQGDSNQKLRIRKRRGLLAHDKEKTFLVAPEPSFNGGTSMSDRLDDERSNRGSVGNTSGYAFSVTAENDDDEYGDYESDEEAAAARARKQFATNGFVVADFGVSLLLNFLKRKQLSRSNEEHQQMVAPMLDLFANCFEQSRSDDLTAKVAQALNNLMTWPLPHATTKKVQKRVRNRVFDVLSERGVDTAAPVVQACFGVLATLLEKRSVDLNKLQNEILVDLIRGSIDSASKLQKSSFKLTKAIIARKILSPCVYDLIEHLCELLVVAQDENVRKDCRAVVMRYLLTYPLSEKRLHSHLVFFVKNLEFDYESGRRSLLSLMYSIANRFPVDVLDVHCEFLFLPLVVRLVNDDSATCRADVGNVLRRLIEAVSAGKKVALTDLCIGWLDAARKNTTLVSAQLGRAGAQVLGFAVEKLDSNLSASSRSAGRFRQVVVRAVQTLEATIREAAEWVSNGGEEDEAERVELEGSSMIRTGTDRDYKVYYSLIASEKLLDHWLSTFLETVGVKKQFIGPHGPSQQAEKARNKKKSDCSSPICASDLGVDFLGAIRTLLLYKHAWVRLSSCRIVGKFFASVTPPRSLLSPAQLTDGKSGARADGEETMVEWKQFQQALYDVTAALCSQFESPSLGEELATQIVKNLVFLGKHFLNLAVGEAQVAVADEQDAEEEEAGGDPSLDEQEDEPHADRGFSSGSRALKWLFHRVSYMARTRGEAQQQSIFKWFAAMATSSVSATTTVSGKPHSKGNAVDILRGYLMHMLSPLVRAAAFVKDGREATPKYAVGELAQEVMAHLESTLGSEAYLPVHMRVIAQIRQSRLERKQKRKLAAVLDPEAHAARKRERNKRKRRQKRTKVDGFRSKDGRDLKRRDQ